MQSSTATAICRNGKRVAMAGIKFHDIKLLSVFRRLNLNHSPTFPPGDKERQQSSPQTNALVRTKSFIHLISQSCATQLGTLASQRLEFFQCRGASDRSVPGVRASWGVQSVSVNLENFGAYLTRQASTVFRDSTCQHHSAFIDKPRL